VKFYNWFLKEAQSVADRSAGEKGKEWSKRRASVAHYKSVNVNATSAHSLSTSSLKSTRSMQRPYGLVQCFTLEKDPVLGFGIHFAESSFDQQQARDCQFKIQPGQQYLVVKETRDAAGRVGPASLQGILPGDVLLKAERQTVQSFGQFSTICRNRRTLFLEMLRMSAKGALAQVGRNLHGAAVASGDDSKKSERILPGIARRFTARRL